MSNRSTQGRGLIGALLVLILVACSSPPGQTEPGPSGQGSAQDESSASRRTKTLTIGISGSVRAMGIAGDATPVGGWISLIELHSDGLVTSDTSSRRPIGRLAERVPSLEDGTISVLPDNRMRVVFNLRRGVTWQDGTPFTAHDLVFTYRLCCDPGIPTDMEGAAPFISSAEAPDDTTFVVYFKQPYYLAATLGPLYFWPVPRHLVEPAYDRYVASRNADEVLNLPYWTTEYVHLGPFRLTRFEPGEGLSFEAYDRYFLGRPKVDVIHVRIFRDPNTLLSNLFAGSVDMVPELALVAEPGRQLKERWESSDAGTVHVQEGSLWVLRPQMRPAFSLEPAILDPRVRLGLYHALDREALSVAVNGGQRQLAAWSLLPSSDPLYEAAREGLRPFSYSPDRARAVLREAGWAAGGDGLLRHASDNRPLRTSIWASPGREQEIAAFAAYWRELGIEVEEFTIGAAQVRDREFRARHPGWDSTGGDIMDMMASTAATAENRWVGNRNGFEDSRAQQLVNALRTSITQRDQLQAMRGVQDYVLTEWPSLPIYFLADYLGVRKGVKAYDDVAGGAVGPPYGGYSRNAYLWDVES